MSFIFSDEKKTSADVKKEGEILTEMLEIVAKRDSLIALLEEERQRWRRPSCPTLTAPIFTNESASKNLHVSYSCILFAFVVAYFFSCFITDILFSTNKEDSSFSS